MKSIAFVFSTSPYGTSLGREGLEILLSTSIITKKIGVFFIGDGIFQIMKHQFPKRIYCHKYVSSFLIVVSYGIKNFYLCKKSIIDRGIKDKNFFLNVVFMNPKEIRKKIDSFNFVLKF